MALESRHVRVQPNSPAKVKSASEVYSPIPLADTSLRFDDFYLAHLVSEVNYEEKSVNVKMKTTLYGLSEIVPGVSDPAEEGQEISVPLWVAWALAREGYVEDIVHTESIRQKLSKYIWQEEQTNNLQKIDENAYAEIGAHLSYARETKDQSLTQLESKTTDLLRMRVKKIRRIAETKDQPEFLKSLTREEGAWFELYRLMFTEWVGGSWLERVNQIKFGATLLLD